MPETHNGFPRIAIFFPLLFSLAAPASAQQVPYAPAKKESSIERIYERMVVDRLESELARIKTVMNLDAEQIVPLRSAGVKSIRELASRVAHSPTKRAASLKGSKLPQTVLRAVLSEVSRNLGKQYVAAYKKDQVDRREFATQTGIEGFLVALDRKLVLSPKQFAELAKLLRSHWSEKLSQLGMMAGQGGLWIIQEPIEQLPQGKLQRILRPSQWTALISPEPQTLGVLMSRAGIEDLQSQKSQYEAEQRKSCLLIAGLKIEDIQATCGLSSEQTSKLTAAIHKAANRIVADRTLAFVKLRQAGPGKTPPAALDALTRDVSEQIDNRPDWKRAVIDSLDSTQLVKLKSRQAARHRRRNRAAFGGIVGGLGQQHGFSADQQMRLVDTLVRETSSMPHERSGEHHQLMLQVSDEKFKEILSDEQWAKVATGFHAMRNQLQDTNSSP